MHGFHDNSKTLYFPTSVLILISVILQLLTRIAIDFQTMQNYDVLPIQKIKRLLYQDLFVTIWVGRVHHVCR